MRRTELRLADGTEVRMGLYVQDGGSLYKISTPYPDSPAAGSTVVVCRDGNTYPERTLVRYLTAEQLAGMEVPSDHTVRNYHNWLDGKGKS